MEPFNTLRELMNAVKERRRKRLSHSIPKILKLPTYEFTQITQSFHSAQSAIKMLVSCGSLPLRFEAHTSFLPSDVNIGNESKSG